MLPQENILDHFPENKKRPEGTWKELSLGFIMAWYTSSFIFKFFSSYTTLKVITSWRINIYLKNKINFSLIYFLVGTIMIITSFIFIKWSNAIKQNKSRFISTSILLTLLCILTLHFILEIRNGEVFYSFNSFILSIIYGVSFIFRMSSYLFSIIMSIWLLQMKGKYRISGIIILILTFIIMQMIDL